MNREEREEHLILLYKEGRTFKDIAKEMHMSFRDIGAIIKKAKLEAERERGYTTDEEPKSPEAQAFKMFSEGKSPVEVAIALDEPGDRVRAMHREYWDLSGRHELAQLYDEARYNLSNMLKLHRIVKDLGLGEKEIIKVLELAKHNELERLQWKVEYLRNEVEILENEKWKSTNHILNLNRMIDQFQSFWVYSGTSISHTGNNCVHMISTFPVPTNFILCPLLELQIIYAFKCPCL
jgi:DNA-binding CsgD family transcriptional regulator